jgi:hypothetical protein
MIDSSRAGSDARPGGVYLEGSMRGLPGFLAGIGIPAITYVVCPLIRVNGYRRPSMVNAHAVTTMTNEGGKWKMNPRALTISK